MNPGQVLGIAFIAHGRADTGVHREGDGAGGPNPVRDAAGVLTLLALGAVRVKGTDHVLGAAAFGLPGTEIKIGRQFKTGSFRNYFCF